jgi:hypothetical protein
VDDHTEIAASSSAQPKDELPTDLVSLRRLRDQLRQDLEQRRSMQAAHQRLIERLGTRIPMEMAMGLLAENQAVQSKYGDVAARYDDVRAEREGAEIRRRWRRDPSLDFDQVVIDVRQTDDAALDLASAIADQIQPSQLTEAQLKERSEVTIAIGVLRKELDWKREPSKAAIGRRLGWQKEDSWRNYLRKNPWLVDEALNYRSPRSGAIAMDRD